MFTKVKLILEALKKQQANVFHTHNGDSSQSEKEKPRLLPFYYSISIVNAAL